MTALRQFVPGALMGLALTAVLVAALALSPRVTHALFGEPRLVHVVPLDCLSSGAPTSG